MDEVSRDAIECATVAARLVSQAAWFPAIPEQARAFARLMLDVALQQQRVPWGQHQGIALMVHHEAGSTWAESANLGIGWSEEDELSASYALARFVPRKVPLSGLYFGSIVVMESGDPMLCEAYRGELVDALTAPVADEGLARVAVRLREPEVVRVVAGMCGTGHQFHAVIPDASLADYCAVSVIEPQRGLQAWESRAQRVARGMHRKLTESYWDAPVPE